MAQTPQGSPSKQLVRLTQKPHLCKERIAGPAAFETDGCVAGQRTPRLWTIPRRHPNPHTNIKRQHQTATHGFRHPQGPTEARHLPGEQQEVGEEELEAAGGRGLVGSRDPGAVVLGETLSGHIDAVVGMKTEF